MSYHWWSKYKGKRAMEGRQRRSTRPPGPGWVPVTMLPIRSGFWRNYGTYVAISLAGGVASVIAAFAFNWLLIFPLFGTVVVISGLTGFTLPIVWYARYRRMQAVLSADDTNVSTDGAETEEAQNATRGFARRNALALSMSAVAGFIGWGGLAEIATDWWLRDNISIVGPFISPVTLLLFVTAVGSLAVPARLWWVERRLERLARDPDLDVLDGDDNVVLGDLDARDVSDEAHSEITTAPAINQFHKSHDKHINVRS